MPTSCAAEWSPIITEGHAFDMGAQLCIGHSASTAAFISSRMRTKARGLAFHHDRPAPHLRPDWIERCDDLNFLGPPVSSRRIDHIDRHPAELRPKRGEDVDEGAITERIPARVRQPRFFVEESM
ncbi:hypothetical protein GCM10007918_00710 [Piscinibacter gummiphilus]|nr:hypothetical protein GCM10007918_00710 [Piscinibacter gummiphilus]